jgi:hypothetical protein
VSLREYVRLCLCTMSLGFFVVHIELYVLLLSRVN